MLPYVKMRSLMVLSALTNIPLLVSAQCPEYVDYALEVHEPLSSGKYQLAYQRPSEECRTFKSQGLEVYTPDVKAFRDFAQKKDLASDLAKNWPAGMLDKINGM